MAKFRPSVGQWYKNMETGETFEVVALADDGMSIEIQHFEGEIAELDSDTWSEMALSLLPPPEDWSGPYDDIEPDDMESDRSANSRRWQNPLDQIE